MKIPMTPRSEASETPQMHPRAFLAKALRAKAVMKSPPSAGEPKFNAKDQVSTDV